MADLICSDLSGAKNINGYPYLNSRIATLEITPYLSEKIEFQYLNQPKQVIGSNGGELSYTLEQETGQCPTQYHIKCKFVNSDLKAGGCGEKLEARTHVSIYGKLRIVRVGFFDIPGAYSGSLRAYAEVEDGLNFPITGVTRYYPFGRKDIYRSIVYQPECKPYSNSTGHALTEELEKIELERVDGLPDNCGECIFKIIETFDDSSEVKFENTTEDCPEVQQIPSGLADEPEIIVKPLGRNEFLLACAGEDYYNSILDLFPFNYAKFVKGNPDHCLLIWSVSVPSGIPKKIAQVCSFINSPAPQLNSNCEEKESCPPSTCEVDCGQHICCYDNKGYVIKTIN